jgi:hypothetical protein
MPDISTELSSTMQELGIDPATIDDGGLETPESAPGESQEVATEGEEVANEEEVKTEDGTEVATENSEVEEKKEAPVEEPKLTHKEFLEIQAARDAFEVEKKSFQEEMTKARAEFSTQFEEKIRQYDEFDSWLSDLNRKDPELFGILQNEFSEHRKHYANPVVDKVSKEIAELRKELSSFKNRASDEVVLSKLNSEWDTFMKGVGKEAEDAGLKLDRKALEDQWAKTGLSLEEAFYAKHGRALLNAKMSKAKVEIAEKKVQAQPKVTTAGAMRRSTSQSAEKIPSNPFDAVKYYAGKIAGAGKA